MVARKGPMCPWMASRLAGWKTVASNSSGLLPGMVRGWGDLVPTPTGPAEALLVSPVSAAEQARGSGWIVGGQDDQVRHLLLEREDFAGGPGEQAPVAHARDLAAFQQFGSLAEVAHQPPRRARRAAG